jgi:hypothetical protein
MQVPTVMTPRWAGNAAGSQRSRRLPSPVTVVTAVTVTTDCLSFLQASYIDSSSPVPSALRDTS